MKTRNKNPALKKMIEDFHQKGVRENKPVWKALSRELNRPRRVSREVNLYTLEKKSRKGETLAVPGVVLGSGGVSRPLNVAALRFSESARKAIEKAGGRCMSLEELVAGRHAKIRIMG